VVEKVCCGTDDKEVAKLLENEKTIEYAIRFGGDRVKGGRYFFPSKLIRKVERIRKEIAIGTAGSQP
jgi:hypothetical protein